MKKVVFNKEKWLQSANEELARGDLSQGDIDNALATWANKYDGKSEEEIGRRLPKKWYIEVGVEADEMTETSKTQETSEDTNETIIAEK